MNYLYFSASRLLARVHRNLLWISKHSDLTLWVQDAVDENDGQNAFTFQSTGTSEGISERSSFLRLSILQTHDLQ